MLCSCQWLHLQNIIPAGFSDTLYQTHREKCEKCKIPSASKIHSPQCRRLTGRVLKAINNVILQLIQNQNCLTHPISRHTQTPHFKNF